jgi:hypothetical protein
MRGNSRIVTPASNHKKHQIMNYRQRSTALKDSQPVSTTDEALKNKAIRFRPLGSKDSTPGITTGRVVENCVEVLFYQPTKILVPRERVDGLNADGANKLVTSLTVKKPSVMTSKNHPATGWMTPGSKGKMLYCRKVGTRTKSMTLHSRQEEVLVFLLNQMRIAGDQVKAALLAFRSDREKALDSLLAKEIFTMKHLRAVVMAETVDLEVSAIMTQLGIVFD